MGGGGNSKSESSSRGMDMNISSSHIDPTQQAYLNRMWGGATSGIMDQGLGQVNQQQQGDAFKMLGVNDYFNQSQQFANPNNTMVQGQIGQLKNTLMDQFTNQMLPQIADSSIQGGALGGGRQGVAQGLGMQGMSNALAQGTQGILSNAYGQAQQASQFGAGLYNQMGQNQMSALSQMQNQQLYPLMSLAQILGNPTVLNQSFGMGGNRSNSQSQSSNFQIG